MKATQFLLSIFLVLNSSCFSRSDSDPSAVPKKNIVNMDSIIIKGFKDELKEASPDFRQGWYDGCETGTHSGSNSFYKIFFKSNKQDGWKMSGSNEYKTAWNYAYWYCYRSEYIDQKSGFWGSIFGKASNPNE